MFEFLALLWRQCGVLIDQRGERFGAIERERIGAFWEQIRRISVEHYGGIITAHGRAAMVTITCFCERVIMRARKAQDLVFCVIMGEVKAIDVTLPEDKEKA